MSKESGLYYLQSRYYNPEISRFINADAFPSTGQGIIGNNMFAYCANNPVIRIDEEGYLWTTVAAIGISAAASVAASAFSAWITGEEFTFGDAVGSAISGAAATAMAIVGVPMFLANPVSTFCGGIIGKYIDGDTSAEAFFEVVDDTKKSAIATVAFAGAGFLADKYAKTFLDGKFLKLNAVEEFAKDLVHKPKYLNESSVSTMIADNFWDGIRSVMVDFVY